MSETFRTRSITDGQVTILANQIMQDDRLSFRARGIAGSAISYPRDWDWSADKLAKHSPNERRDAIRTALKELETYGYLKRSRHRGSDGRWVWSWQLRDTPVPDVSAGQPMDGLSVDGVTSNDSPMPENPSMVPSGETHVSAGRTIDGSTVDGSSVDIPKEDQPKEERRKEDQKLTNQRFYGSVGAREGSDVVGSPSGDKGQTQDQDPNLAPTVPSSDASRLLDALPVPFRLDHGRVRDAVERDVETLLGRGVWDYSSLLENLGRGALSLPAGSNPIGILRWRVQEAGKRVSNLIQKSVGSSNGVGRFQGFKFPWCQWCSSPSQRWVFETDSLCRCASEFVEPRFSGDRPMLHSARVSGSEASVNGSGVLGDARDGFTGSDLISEGSGVGVFQGLSSLTEVRSGQSRRTY